MRLNGLPRLDPAFDRLIAHPGYLPYLLEFMADPQLANTWSISKYPGRGATGWHSGIQPADYTVRGGKIRSPMVTNWMSYTIPDRSIPGAEKSDD